MANKKAEPIEPGEVSATSQHEKAMDVKIYAPFKVYYEGRASSVSAVNETGPFDILPGHYNFMCMLVPCDIKVALADTNKTIPIHRALMHVKADRVVVFVDV